MERSCCRCDMGETELRKYERLTIWLNISLLKPPGLANIADAKVFAIRTGKNS